MRLRASTVEWPAREYPKRPLEELSMVCAFIQSERDCPKDSNSLREGETT